MSKVLICSNVYPPNFIGGAELMAHYQGLALKRQGWDVAVFAGDLQIEGARYSVSKQSYDGLPVYRVKLLPDDHSPEFTNFFHEAVERQFVRVLDEFRPDVVHAHNLTGLSLGILHASRIRGIRTAVTFHDHWAFCYKNTLLKRASEVCQDHSKCAECMAYVPNGGHGFPIQMRQSYMGLQMEDVDAFISPSEYLADKYVSAGFPASKMNRIWYGIDVSRLSSIRKTPPNGRVRFTFIGFLGAHKGVRTLIEALSLIPMPDKLMLNLVGGHGELSELKRLVETMGLQSSVRFWGNVDNKEITEVFRQTDVQILPSIWPENQPVTITEAMASRTAVIASRMGGIPELVEDGQNGYLFEAGNPVALAEKMTLFITNPKLIQTFGEEGYRRISDKSIDKQVRSIRELYDRLMSTPRTKSPPAANLILCAGTGFNPDCTRAITDLWESTQEPMKYRFVMVDWLAEDQFLNGRILWVVGADCAPEVSHRALRCHIPLLVPEANRELKELCRTGGCGLYYADADQARESLRYLFENYSVLAQLASNAGICGRDSPRSLFSICSAR
jgi:glycosyltransferase involved in cell wall biosynthesis